MPSAVAGSNCGHIYMPSAPRELTNMKPAHLSKAMSALQTGFNVHSRIRSESISNPLQTRPHYRFAMRIRFYVITCDLDRFM